MTTLRIHEPVVKPRVLPHTDTCLECRGAGHVMDGWGGLTECPACDGFGQLKRIDLPTAESEPTDCFIAYGAGGHPVETTDTLAALIDLLQREWSLEDEDVVCWRLARGRGPRVVALVRPGKNGRLTVQVV